VPESAEKMCRRGRGVSKASRERGLTDLQERKKEAGVQTPAGIHGEKSGRTEVTKEEIRCAGKRGRHAHRQRGGAGGRSGRLPDGASGTARATRGINR